MRECDLHLTLDLVFGCCARGIMCSEKVQQWKGKALAQAAVMLLASSISAFLGSRRSIRSHGLNIGEARVPQRQATGAGGREMVPVHQEISNTPSITSETLSVSGAMN